MGKSTKRTAKSEGSGDEANEYEEDAGWGDKISPQDAAGYINDLALEMKSLAESARLSFLSYLIELVIEESATQKRRRL